MPLEIRDFEDFINDNYKNEYYFQRASYVSEDNNGNKLIKFEDDNDFYLFNLDKMKDDSPSFENKYKRPKSTDGLYFIKKEDIIILYLIEFKGGNLDEKDIHYQMEELIVNVIEDFSESTKYYLEKIDNILVNVDIPNNIRDSFLNINNNLNLIDESIHLLDNEEYRRKLKIKFDDVTEDIRSFIQNIMFLIINLKNLDINNNYNNLINVCFDYLLNLQIRCSFIIDIYYKSIDKVEVSLFNKPTETISMVLPTLYQDITGNSKEDMRQFLDENCKIKLIIFKEDHDKLSAKERFKSRHSKAENYYKKLKNANLINYYSIQSASNFSNFLQGQHLIPLSDEIKNHDVTELEDLLK